MGGSRNSGCASSSKPCVTGLLRARFGVRRAYEAIESVLKLSAVDRRSDREPAAVGVGVARGDGDIVVVMGENVVEGG
jgi:hypothetical protein